MKDIVSIDSIVHVIQQLLNSRFFLSDRTHFLIQDYLLSSQTYIISENYVQIIISGSVGSLENRNERIKEVCTVRMRKRVVDR